MALPIDIGIVIVNYNVRHFLIQCLKSIFNSQTQGLKVEVWVVDNASIDGSVELLMEEFPQVHLIRNTQNVGFSKANNQAIELINAKYTLLLNPDTIIEELTLQKCYDFMEAHLSAGALGVRMIDGAGVFLAESKRKVPDLWSSFCKLSYLSDLFPRSKWFSGYNLGYLSEHETHEIEVLCGAFMFMRKEVLAQVGLLDEAFFMYGEDIDLSYRIVQAGWKIYYFPDTSIIHYKGESTKKASLNYIKTFYGAMSIYVDKHYSKGNARFFARLINVAIFLRALVSGMFGLFKALLWPIFDFLLGYWMVSQIKTHWASYYFKNPHYYDNSPIGILIVVYLLLWLGALWVNGHYDKDSKYIHIGKSIMLGTVAILILYALLPVEMRTSRAIILIGAGIMALEVGLTLWLRQLLQSKSNDHLAQHIAIVASKSQALKLTELLNQTSLHPLEITYISPSNGSMDAFYSNTMENIRPMVEALRIDEIIFSSDEVNMSDIISIMMQLDKSVKYRMGNSESLVVVGSSNKNTKGELIHLNVNYPLARSSQKRWKRIFDIGVAVLMIPFIPLLFVVTGLKLQCVSNIFAVIMGQKTWLGYGGDNGDYNFLPTLPIAVVSYPHTQKLLEFEPKFFKSRNIEYAQTFNVFNDFMILLKNINKVSDSYAQKK